MKAATETRAFFCFFFNDAATTEIYTLSLHDALPISFKNLSIADFNERRNNFAYPQIGWFQDRGHSIQAIDDFLLSPIPIFLIIGGNYIGKKTVVWHALEKKKHNRLPLFINLTPSFTCLQVAESIAVQLGLSKFIDVEILASLKSLSIDKLFIELCEIINTIAKDTILLMDGFENILDPNQKIIDAYIEKLINYWSSIDGAKIIIESRSNIDQIPPEQRKIEYVSIFKSRENTPRFGSYLYSVQLLQELIPNEYRLTNQEYGGFPRDLLVALDNHPYFLYLAGIIIRNSSNTSCLSDDIFVNNLKVKLADTLFSTFNLTENEKELAYSLTLIPDNFPLKLVNMVTGNHSISQKLMEKGLLLQVAPNRYRPIGILQSLNRQTREIYEKNQVEKKWHGKFYNVYQLLYKELSDPSFYRLARYHALLSGEKIESSAFNIPQISECAESWHSSKNFKDALWAYREIQKKRKLTPKEEMRMASCLLRTEKLSKGKGLYENLKDRYPDWLGVKNSYIDSLLSTGKCAPDALEQLVGIDVQKRDYYWHRQIARCYRQLSKRKDSYDEYEKAILNAPLREAYYIIKELITYAREIRDTDKVDEWTDYAKEHLKISF